MQVPSFFRDQFYQAREAVDRYYNQHDISGLDEAVEIWPTILQHPRFQTCEPTFRAAALTEASESYFQRYLAKGAIQDLNQAVNLNQEGIEAAPPGWPAIAGLRSNLGAALIVRYERNGNLSDLDLGIEAIELAVEEDPIDSPHVAGHLSNLGNALLQRYARTGQLADLSKAVIAFDDAVTRTSEGEPALPGFLNGLSNSLYMRYKNKGSIDDLNIAISTLRKAINLTPEDSKFMLDLLYSLGIRLSDRYDHLGNVRDLCESEEILKEATKSIHANSPSYPDCLNAMGCVSIAQYERTGSKEYLEQAIQLNEQALARTPKHAPKRNNLYNSLGSVQLRLSEITLELTDVGRAIDSFQQAVSLTPAQAPVLCERLHNLAHSMNHKYELTRNLTDLEDAIELSKRALAETSNDSPVLSGHLSGLGGNLITRYRCTGDVIDLEEGINALERAIALAPPKTPTHLMMLHNLAVGLRFRYDHRQAISDRKDAVRRFELAAQLGTELGHPIALKSGHTWGDWAFERLAWSEAIYAYRYAWDASNYFLRAQILNRSKERWLRKSAGIAGNLAYALAKTGDLEGAVIALERGSARLLSIALEQSKKELEQLKELGYSNLFDTYCRILARQQQLEVISERPEKNIPDEVLLASMRTIREKLSGIISQIRQVKGYENFLADPTFEAIARNAKVSHPLVYLVTTTVGSVGLIVSSHHVEPIWMDGFNTDDLYSLLYAAKRREIDRRFPSLKFVTTDVGGWVGGLGRQVSDPNGWQGTINQVTERLWDLLIGPVITQLKKMNVQHAVFVPTGKLAQLPLHAAWRKESTALTGRHYAVDSIIINYVPNARALEAARLNSPTQTSDSILLIQEPRPVSAKSIPWSGYEVQAAASHFKTYAILKYEEASRPNILTQLPGFSIIHFACHGDSNYSEPLQSALVMANNENLTLRDLLRVSLKKVRLAVLSACETGIPGSFLPEEVIGLWTGLLQAGASSVVTSLWSVSDASTALLMARFYDLWRSQEIEACDALCQAQQWVRDTTNQEKVAYLELCLQNLDGQNALRTAIESLYHELILAEPDERAHSHPFHWAAFFYGGV